MSMSAGMTVFPVKSTRAAPAGSWSSPFLPTLVNFVPSTRNDEFSIGARPSPAIRRAPSNKTAPRAGRAWLADTQTTAVAKSSTQAHAFITRIADSAWDRDRIPGTRRSTKNTKIHEEHEDPRRTRRSAKNTKNPRRTRRSTKNTKIREGHE